MEVLQRREHPLDKVIEVPADNSQHDLFYKAQQFHEGIRKGLWETELYLLERTVVGPLKDRSIVRDHFSGNDREMIMMGGNDYLGLGSDPRLAEAAIEAIRKYGTGTHGSSILTGQTDLHLALEERLAHMVGCEAATLFTSGYAANLGIISSLAGEGDAVINDTINHASIIDGSRFSGATFRTFKHNNVKHLEKVLQECQAEYQGSLVAIDAVFSMDGDIAPVPEIAELARHYGARLMIDEAHSTGVLGEHGWGSCEYFGLEGKVDLVMGSLSKGVGVLGAFVAGPKEIVHFIRINARPRIFSYSLTAAHVAAILKALDIIEQEPERRANLWRNINYMHRELRNLGFDIGNPHSAIIPVMVRSDKKLWPMGRMLQEMGIFCNVIAYPAVAPEKTRIRLSLRATHSMADLDETLYAFEKAGKAAGLI